MSREYLIVLPIEPIPAHGFYASNESLPLHCTIMHWFRPSQDCLRTLDEGIERVALEPEFQAIELVSERAELFGPNNDIPVHVLADNDQLRMLHTSVFTFLKQMNSLPEELQWVGDKYRPHVTDTRFRHFPPGTRHRPRSLALIERGEAREKFVTGTYMLGHAPF